MTTSEASAEESKSTPPKGLITTIEQAKRYSEQAALAAFFMGGLTTLLYVVAANASSTDERLAYYADPWIFVDVALIFLCGVGLMRCSRVAAVMMLIGYTLGIIDKALTMESASAFSAIPAIAFVLLYGRGAKGAFAYHRIRKEMDPGYRVKGKWLLWLFGAPIVGIVLLIGTWFGLMELALIPSYKILSGEEMAGRHLELLRSEGVIEEGEQLIWFYSDGLFSILEDGNLITDRRIIAFATDDEGVFVSQAGFETVDCVNVSETDDFANMTFEVVCRDGEAFVLWFPSDDEYYTAFTNYLGTKVTVNYRAE